MNNLLPHFFHLQHLHLGEGTFEDSTLHQILRRLPFLRSLSFGPGAILTVPTITSIMTKPTRLRSLAHLRLDNFSAKRGYSVFDASSSAGSSGGRGQLHEAGYNPATFDFESDSEDDKWGSGGGIRITSKMHHEVGWEDEVGSGWVLPDYDTDDWVRTYGRLGKKFTVKRVEKLLRKAARNHIQVSGTAVEAVKVWQDLEEERLACIALRDLENARPNERRMKKNGGGGGGGRRGGGMGVWDLEREFGSLGRAEEFLWDRGLLERKELRWFEPPEEEEEEEEEWEEQEEVVDWRAVKRREREEDSEYDSQLTDPYD